MWIIKAFGIGLLVGTLVCLSWAGIDTLKHWLDLTVQERSWRDTFFGAASGASAVYIWLTQEN